MRSFKKVTLVYGIAYKGMRINPVASLGHRREVPVDSIIGGHQVPAGVRFHHDKYFNK